MWKDGDLERERLLSLHLKDKTMFQIAEEALIRPIWFFI
jgi:hypothetical protein